ncbi:MAG: secretion system protein, partial [Pyrobaculum sp.]
RGRDVVVADASEITPPVSQYVEEMYGVRLKEELTLRTEALVKASDMEDPLAARRSIVDTVWTGRLDFKTPLFQEAARSSYENFS